MSCDCTNDFVKRKINTESALRFSLGKEFQSFKTLKVYYYVLYIRTIEDYC